jgi:hypothetical protein
MIVTVYHHDFPDHPEALTAVATVQVAPTSARPNHALERAFRLTQNLEGSRSRGPTLDNGKGFMVDNPDHDPAVTVLAPLPVIDGQTYGLRSSMMGDVFEVGGTRYRVAAMGFTPL